MEPALSEEPGYVTTFRVKVRYIVEQEVEEAVSRTATAEESEEDSATVEASIGTKQELGCST